MKTFKKLTLIELKSWHREERTNRTGNMEVQLDRLSERRERGKGYSYSVRDGRGVQLERLSERRERGKGYSETDSVRGRKGVNGTVRQTQ